MLTSMELFGWSEEKKERAFRQGLAAYLEKDYRPAIDSLRSAWHGHKESQFFMGVMSEFGYGLAQSKISSFDWYKKAGS